MAPVDSAETRQSAPRQWFSGALGDAGVRPEVSQNYLPDVLANIPSRYEILSHVGTGGMGIVFKVSDRDTGEIVALKILKPGLASAEAMQENLRKEVCLARKVTHKNVCRIHEFNRSKSAACISMEFVEGESLLSKLRRGGPLPAREAIEIARQICAGLHEAHAQGIVHRDLKPANIMVDRSGTVKIMDFGIARLTEEDGQMTGTIAGTPSYMAPEQLELKAMGPQTDIYSLGLLLYEMVTGSPAFEGDTPIAIALKQIRESPKRPTEIVSALPVRAEAIIMKCLRKDPSKRFQSVDELDAALENETASKAPASWEASVEKHLERLAKHRAVQSGLARFHAAVPHFVSFSAEVRRASLHANQVAIRRAKEAVAFLRAQDWRAATKTRTGQAVAVLLGVVIVFGVAAGRKSHVTGVAAGPLVAPAMQTPPSAHARGEFPYANTGPAFAFAAPSTLPPGSVTTDHIDLIKGSAAASASPSDATSTPAPTKPKSPASAQPSASSPRHTNSAQRKPAQALAVGPQVPAATVGPSVPPADDLKSANPQPDASATAPAAASSNPAPKPTDATAAPKPAQQTLYLEVGSFKDANWAQTAVEKLSQLGYHAISVHQSHLWMQSFHVQVGPFSDANAVADAQKTLTSQGYKSHLVK